MKRTTLLALGVFALGLGIASANAAASPATTEWMDGGDTLTTFHNVSLLLYGNLVSAPTIVRTADGALGVRINGHTVPVRPNGLTRPPEAQEEQPSTYKPDPEWLAGVQQLKNQAVKERDAVLARSTTPAAMEVESAVAAVYRASPLVERVEVKNGLVRVFFAPNSMGVTSFGHYVTPDPPAPSVGQGGDQQRKPRSDWVRGALWHTLTRNAGDGVIVIISDHGRVAGTLSVDVLDRVITEIGEAKGLLTNATLDEASKIWPSGKVLSPDRAWETAHPIPL